MVRFRRTTKGGRFFRLWRRFRNDGSGVVAIEAALALPVMVLAYVGMVNVAQMVMVNRKVTQLSMALSDLTARLSTVPPAEISSIFDAAQTILLPYDSKNANMMIASVVIGADRIGRVCWANSYPDASSAPARNTAVSLPDSIRVANTSVIMAQASYTFTPLIGDAIFRFFGGTETTGDVTLGGNPIYTRPRDGKAAGDNNIEQIVRTDVKACPKF